MYGRLLSSWVAGLAALLYALDCTHGVVVGWVAARNAILATLFGILSLICHDRWRRSQWQPGVLLGPGLLLAALLASQAAVATLSYIAAHAIFLDTGRRSRRLASIVPYAAVTGAWQVVYAKLGYGFSALLAKSAVARFLAFGQLIAAFATCTASPEDRYLLFTGIGAMGLLAHWIGWLTEERRSSPRRSMSLVAASVLLVIHLVVAPVRLVEATARPARISRTLEAQLEGFPLDERVAAQTIVIVNAPSADALAYLPFIRAARGEPLPAHTRLLAAGSAPLEIARPHDRTLVVRSSGGYGFYFGENQPLPLGYQLSLMGMTIEVTALTTDRRPAEATVRFDIELDDPSLRWLRWTVQDGGGRYVDFQPPAVGERVSIQ
jgi:hypothetical protein